MHQKSHDGGPSGHRSSTHMTKQPHNRVPGIPEIVSRSDGAIPTRVSGAWVPGDDPHSKKFAEVVTDRPFHLESGGKLDAVTIAYETWGELNQTRSNAVLVCHALTGDSHAATTPNRPSDGVGWWANVIGPGKAIDTDRYFVIASNVLGGCRGTTGPASINPATSTPYGSLFPTVTIRDMVRAQSLLADQLGIEKLAAVVGGSMGGMQALEWAVMFPHRISSMVALATSAKASAQQIAWSMVGRRAIEMDPGFNGGEYYDLEPKDGPYRGLRLARQIAHIHYRSDEVFESKFGRQTIGPSDTSAFGANELFDVEGYLRYQGDKLVARFDANSYLRLNRAMDLHDLGRGRGGIEAALSRVRVPSMVMSISSDILYPPHQQYELRDLLSRQTRCGFYEIDSPHGHDAFLLEGKQIAALLEGFVDAGLDPINIPGDFV